MGAIDPQDIQDRLNELRDTTAKTLTSIQQAVSDPTPTSQQGLATKPGDFKALDDKVRQDALEKAKILDQMRNGPAIGAIPGGTGPWSKLQEAGNILRGTPVAPASSTQVKSEQNAGDQATQADYYQKLRETKSATDQVAGMASAFTKGLSRGPAELADTLTLGKYKFHDTMAAGEQSTDSEDMPYGGRYDPNSALYKFLTGKQLTTGKISDAVGELSSDIMFLYAPISRAVEATGIGASVGGKFVSAGFKKLGPIADGLVSDALTGGILGAKDGWQSAAVDATLFGALGIPLRLVAGSIGDAVTKKMAERATPKFDYSSVTNGIQLFDTFVPQVDQAQSKSLKELSDRVIKDWFDRYNPLQQFQKMYFASTGQPLDKGIDPYISARTYNATSTKITDWLQRRAKPFIKSVGEKDWVDLNVYAASLDAKDRIALSEDWAKAARRRGITTGTLDDYISKIESFWGPDKTVKMRALAQEGTRINNEGMDYMVAAGLVGKENAIRMREAHPHYVTFQKFNELADDYTQKLGVALQGFNPGKSEKFKPIKGMTAEGTYQLPFDAMVQRMPKFITMAEQNKIGQQVVNMRNVMPELYGNMIRPVSDQFMLSDIVGDGNEALARHALHYKSVDGFQKWAEKIVDRPFGADIPKYVDAKLASGIPLNGQEKMYQLAQQVKNLGKEDLNNLFEKAMHFKGLKAQPLPGDSAVIPVWFDGKPIDFYVPKEIGNIVLGMQKGQLDFVTSMTKNMNELFRGAVTTFNPTFTVSNAYRDFSNQMLVADNPVGPAYWLKGFFRAIKGDTVGDEVWAAAKQYGVGSGTDTLAHDIHNLTKYATVKNGELDLSGISQKLMDEGTLKSMLKNAVKPRTYLDMVEHFNSWIEMAPRLGVIEKGMKNGLNPLDAAWDAKNATIDFYKAGLKGQILNQYIPFFNARLQGTTNVFKAIIDHPARSMAVITAGAVIPEIVTYWWNTRMYPKWADQVSRGGGDYNLRIIFGESVDENGKMYPKYADLPKEDYQRIFGKLTREALRFLDDRDPSSIDAIAGQLLNIASPVDMIDDKGDLSLGTFAKSVLPPFIRAGAEALTGKHIDTGQNIESGGLGYDTNLSPRLKYEPTGPNKTGSGAKIIGNLFNASPELLEYFAKEAFGIYGQAVMGPEKIADFAVNRFYKTKANQLTSMAIDAFNKTDNFLADKQRVKDIQAQIMATTINDMDVPGAKKVQIIQSIADQNPDMADKIIAAKRKLMTPGYVSVIERAPINSGARAKVIYDFVNSIPKANPELKSEILNTLSTAKTKTGQLLLTDEVVRQLKMLQELKGGQTGSSGKSEVSKSAPVGGNAGGYSPAVQEAMQVMKTSEPPKWIQDIKNGKTLIQHGSKGESTMNSVSFEQDGKFYVAPSIRVINGKATQLSSKDAIGYAIRRADAVGPFNSQKEADAWDSKFHETEYKRLGVGGSSKNKWDSIK